MKPLVIAGFLDVNDNWTGVAPLVIHGATQLGARYLAVSRLSPPFVVPQHRVYSLGGAEHRMVDGDAGGGATLLHIFHALLPVPTGDEMLQNEQ
jgi:hypothetical protein